MRMLERCLCWAVTLGCGLLLTTPAGAYSVANHVALTSMAVRLVNKCRAEQGLNTPHLDDYLMGILEHYNAEQDQWKRKTGLWHFPPTPDDGDCPGPFPACLMVIERSYQPWVDSIWHQAEAGLAADKLYPALGVALHYVQDLAVPAHALPVFHPAGLFHFSDGFDEYNYKRWDTAVSRPADSEYADECKALTQFHSLDEILQSIRSDTLRSLQETFQAQVDGKSVQKPFSMFWRHRPSGFGEYACDDDFGASQVSCDGTQYDVADREYKRYASRRARAAIRASAAAIVLFQQKLAPCKSGACKPVSGDAHWFPTREHIHALKK